MAHTHQFGAGGLRHWIASACLLLMLAFAGLEAVHAHYDLPNASSAPCVICLSAHAKAPPVAPPALLFLLTVAMAVVPFEIQPDSLARKLDLFTRPPPFPL